MLFVLVVTAANLLLSTIDGMMERRRPLAILSAIGVPAGVIRRSVLFQVALPLAAALVLGGSVGLAVTALVFKIASEPVLLPLPGTGSVDDARECSEASELVGSEPRPPRMTVHRSDRR